MNVIYMTGRFIAVLLAASLFMAGCSIMRPIYGDSFHISRSKPGNASSGDRGTLRLKIVAAPMINMADLDDERVEALTETWVNLLKEDESLLVTTLTGPEDLVLDIASAETGVYIDPALIEKAREMEMNILITSLLAPLHYSADKGIFWPFNKFKGEYDVSMIACAVDAATGTVIFTFKENEKIKMGQVPEGQTSPIPLDQDTLDNVLHVLQQRLASAMMDLLKEQPWTGKISLDNGRIRIGGGADVGITTGDVFNVFEKGEAVKSVTGRVYYSNSPKAGEIKVTEVMEDHSFAVPLGENVFEAGQVITLKTE
ncbi:MAG: hypothetical protein JW944_15240 [Deltaproteobacteria bacterium]|nr:hypothetical protein [Deltaproteobacteria bacterium]